MEQDIRWISLRLRSIVLLGGLLAVIVTMPLQASGRVVGSLVDLFYIGVFCLSGSLLLAKRRWMLIYLVMALPTLVFGVLKVTPARIAELVLVGDFLTLGLQFLLIDAVIRYALFRDSASQADRILAGICGYLILGLMFANLYFVVEKLLPGEFSTGGEPLVMSAAECTYFSFVTLTTLGYGEIVPSGDWGRMLVSLEAIGGTLYLAVFVASLISGLRIESSVDKKVGE